MPRGRRHVAPRWGRGSEVGRQVRALGIASVLALAACSFPRTSDQFTCEVDTDCTGGRVCERGFCVIATDAAPVDTIDAPFFDCTLWTPTPRHFDPCAIPQPAGPLTLDMAGTYTLDTATGMVTNPMGATSTPSSTTVASGFLLSVTQVSIAAGSTLRVVGDQPLIVASWTDIDVAGAIDAGSTAAAPGPGANPADCDNRAATKGGDSGAGASGGGGGSFQGLGGNGGLGDGGSRGQAGGTVATAPLLLGGCPGAIGGTGDVPGGSGGAGGGALQLTAQGMLTISGSINAGGAGGDPGQPEPNTGDGGGGGAGGSGGMIGLDAANVVILTGAAIAANGGAGGEGGDNDAGARGADGTATDVRAPGGAVGGGGNGGLGSGGAVLSGQRGGDDGDGGGGGGGGGAGFIVIASGVPATIGTATVSPAPTTL